MAFMEKECDADAAAERLGHELAENRSFRPVSADPHEQRLWLDHDLASIVENRLGLLIEPDRLQDSERRELHASATLENEGLNTWSSKYFNAYWLMKGSDHVGTVAVANSLLGRRFVGVSSLYVCRAHRGRGHAAGALDAIFAAALAAGLSGIRLSTDWSWQGAVRLYLKLGFWVWGWKRSLDFVRSSDLPPWQVVTEGGVARFIVTRGNQHRTLFEARRAGCWLNWVETPSTVRAQSSELESYAPGTFALALAIRGFPLISSEEEWRAQLRRGFSDCGGPEGLAFKIRRFEAWDREHGWLTPAPRIPGLDYPDWGDAE